MMKEENDCLEEERSLKRKEKSSFYNGLFVGMSAALLILCAVYLGVRVSDGMFGKQTGDTVFTSEMKAKIQKIESMVDYYFYQDGIEREAMREGAYKGMLAALGDPYSEYYSAEELQNVINQVEGVFYGIGAYISLDKNTSLPKISGVMEGMPAAVAGLRADDIIYAVDGEETYNMSLQEAVSAIKGAEGTTVELTIAREGETDYLIVEVERQKVEEETVVFEMLEDNIAYIQIMEFDTVTVDQFAEALAMAKGSGMEGLVLDLRANPGGSMDAVVEIAQMLLPEGLVVYTEDKWGERVEYTCDGSRQLQVPCTVLVDYNSASAAEILAGAIKDHGIGTLVGTTTYGKGIVQNVFPLEDGSAVKLTISNYYTPNGQNIHEIGIEPHVVCEFDGEAYYREENPYDNQLNKAVEVLKEKMK